MTKTIFRYIILLICSLTITAAVSPVHAELVAGNSALINYTKLNNKEYKATQDLFIKKWLSKTTYSNTMVLLRMKQTPLSKPVPK